MNQNIDNQTAKQLNRIEEILKSQNAEPMSLEQACNYLGFKKSYLYKLTSMKLVPYFKPNGKKIYFEKSDLNNWIFQNRHKTKVEIEEEAERISGNIIALKKRSLR